MSNERRVSVQAFPVGFVLFLVFLVLKLTEVIDWSWWWVTAPLWIPFLLILLLTLPILAVVALVGTRSRRGRPVRSNVRFR